MEQQTATVRHVVVFKYPGPTAGEAPGSQNNYIKRLVGLPGEQMAFIDGDVFTRRPTEAQQKEQDPWAGEGWKIARKPERVQRAVWQPMFDSQYTPWDAQQGKGQFTPPWKGTTAGARSWAQLPAQAIKYVKYLEELIECPVALLSTSPERDDTILMKDPFED